MPLYHVTLISNLESIMANGLIPQVGALSEMVGEQPGVFLFPNYADCENALWNWLGEELEELTPNEEAVSLEINLPDHFPLEESVEWERISREVIPPQYIRFYKNEG